MAESAKQLAMLAERERQQRGRQLLRTVRRDDDDEHDDEDDDEDDDDDVGHDRVSTLAAAQWKSLMASRTTARAGHAAATASLQVLSQFSDEATGSGWGSDGGGGGVGGRSGPLTRPPQHLQRRHQMLNRMEALRQETLSAQANLQEEHQRLRVALEVVVQQQQLHELRASPTSLLPRVGLLRPSIKRNAVAPVVVWRAHSDLDRSSSAIDSASSTSSTSSTSTSAINSAINSVVNSDVDQPHTDQEDAARPSLTAVTPMVGHRLARRAPRRVLRRIVPKSAATTGQQQRRSVLNYRRQATSSPSATGSGNAAAPAAEALGALEAARQQKKAADAKARAAKARKALSPEYMRKAAAAMFEKASVAQQNVTQATQMK